MHSQFKPRSIRLQAHVVFFIFLGSRSKSD